MPYYLQEPYENIFNAPIVIVGVLLSETRRNPRRAKGAGRFRLNRNEGCKIIESQPYVDSQMARELPLILYEEAAFMQVFAIFRNWIIEEPDLDGRARNTPNGLKDELIIAMDAIGLLGAGPHQHPGGSELQLMFSEERTGWKIRK